MSHSEDAMDAPRPDVLKLYLIRETMIALVINSVLSLVFALLVAHGRPEVPLWGVPGVAFDFVPQLLAMTFATTLAITLVARARIRAGKIETIAYGGAAPRLPANPFLAALTMAVAAAVVLTPLSVLGLVLVHITAIAAAPFIVFKVVYGAAVSIVLAPLMVMQALRR